MDGLDDVFRLLEEAKSLEKDGQRIEASTKYYEGCHLMRQIIAKTQLEDIDPVVVLLKEKIQFYTLQAQRLYFDEESVISPTRPKRSTTPATIILSARTSDDISILTLPGNQSSVFTDMHRRTGIGNAWLERAIHLEEEITNKTQYSNTETIIQSYMGAAEAYLSVVRLSEESSLSLPSIVQSRLVACLDRVEILKKQPSTVRKPKHPAMNKGIT